MIYISNYKCPKCGEPLRISVKKPSPCDWVMCFNCNYNDYIILTCLNQYKYPIKRFRRDLLDNQICKDLPLEVISLLEQCTAEDLERIVVLNEAKEAIRAPHILRRNLYYANMMDLVSGEDHYKDGSIPILFVEKGDMTGYAKAGISLRLTNNVHVGDTFHIALPLYRERNNLIGFECLYKHADYDKHMTRIAKRSYITNKCVDFCFPYLSYKEQDKKHFKDIILTNDIRGYLRLMDWLYTDYQYNSLDNAFSHDVQIVYLAGDLKSSIKRLLDYDWSTERVTLLLRHGYPRMVQSMTDLFKNSQIKVDSLRYLDKLNWPSEQPPICVCGDYKDLCHYIKTYFKLLTYHPNKSRTELP